MPRFQNVDIQNRELFDLKFRDFFNGDGFQLLGFGSRHLGQSTVSPLDTTAVPVPDGSSLHYFLKIDGIAGDSTDETYKGSFAVDGFSFGSTNSASGRTSGAAAGRATFSPLTVDISSLVGLAPLLADEASGRSITSVELIGVTNGSNQAVYDLKLSNAELTSYENTPGAAVDTSLAFDFQKASLTDHGVTLDGELGPPQTATVTASRFEPPASLPNKASPVPDGSSLHYFLKINGIAGDSTDETYKGSFAVDGFSFGSTNSASGRTSGAAAGRATFSPLTVDISSLVGLAPLLADEASGRSITSVELIGVTNGSNQAVYDLKLSNAELTSYENTPGAAVDTSLAFDFQKASLTDHGVTLDGELGPPQTATVTASRFEPPASLPNKASPVPDGSSLHYFLKINGIAGDSTDETYKGSFAVDGFSFGSTNSASGRTSGAAAGRATFSPLTVDISSLVGLAPLLADEASGRSITSVELIGVTNGSNQAVYDLKLSNAELTSYENTPGAAVDTSLAFDFQKASLTDHGVTLDGELGPPQTATVTASRFEPPASLPNKASPVPDGSSLHYFLKINGIAGDSTDETYKGSFAVDGFSFGSTNSASGRTSGAAAGRATFSPLTVDISSLVGLAPLLADEASGRSITSVELIGVTNGSNQAVYDLKLNNAVAVLVQTVAGLHGIDASVAFDFQKATLTDHGVNSDGTLGLPQATSLDAQHHLITSGSGSRSA